MIPGAGSDPALLRALMPCRENPTSPEARLVLADLLENLDLGPLASHVRLSLEQGERRFLKSREKNKYKPIEFVENGLPGFTAARGPDSSSEDDPLPGESLVAMVEMDPTHEAVTYFDGLLYEMSRWRPRFVPIVARFSNMALYPNLAQILLWGWVAKTRILHLEKCVMTLAAWERLALWKPLAEKGGLILRSCLVTEKALEHLSHCAAKSDWQLLDLRDNGISPESIALPGFSRIPKILI